MIKEGAFTGRIETCNILIYLAILNLNCLSDLMIKCQVHTKIFWHILMKPIIPYKGGYEYDAFSRFARKVLSFRPGTRRWLKRKFWKRARKTLRLRMKNNETISSVKTDDQIENSFYLKYKKGDSFE